MSDRNTGDGSITIAIDGALAKWLFILLLGAFGGFSLRDGVSLSQNHEERGQYEALHERLESLGQRIDNIGREVRDCPHRHPSSEEGE